MIFGVSTRHPFQRGLVVECAEAARNRARQAIESFRVVSDRFAQPLQLRSRRLPDACAESGSARVKVEVIAGASRIRLDADGARRIEMVEPASCGSLVRRFVL